MICDFEKGLENAVGNVFNCCIGYCIFHFGQAICRKIKDVKLDSKYMNNLEVNKKFRKILILPYLEIEKVYNAYLNIKLEMVEYHEDLDFSEFFEYFERY